MESSLIIPIITGIVAALAGLGLGKLIFAKDTQARVEEVKKQAAQILSDAESKHEILKKEKLLEATKRFVQLMADHDRHSMEKNKKIKDAENRIKQKEPHNKQKVEN